MRIAYLIDSVEQGGGAEESVAALALELLRDGIAVDVLVLHDWPGFQDHLEASGARVVLLAGRGGHAGWMRRAVTELRLSGPDLVHTALFDADITGRIGARLAGIPVVSSLVTESYGPDHLADPAVSTWKLRVAQSLDGMTARLTRRLHAVSSQVADTVARRIHYPRTRIDVIPRGRDPVALGVRSNARRRAARSGLGVSDDQRLVLAVARQDYAKGLDRLIDAVPLLRDQIADVRVAIAGSEGGETERLHAAVKARGLQECVSFLGRRVDAPELFCAADVFVLPSRREGFAGVLLEAMALETPIVASDIPQIREIVSPTCAVLSDAGVSAQFARDIARTLSNPQEAANRSIRARRRFEECFTIEQVTKEMMSFYERALAGAPRQRSGS